MSTYLKTSINSQQLKTVELDKTTLGLGNQIQQQANNLTRSLTYRHHVVPLVIHFYNGGHERVKICGIVFTVPELSIN
jgi:hypothetical protein